MATARAIAFVSEVSDDAHVAEAVATSSEERILDDLHANWAKEVLVRLRHGGRRTFTGGGAGGVQGNRFRRFGFNGGDERPH